MAQDNTLGARSSLYDRVGGADGVAKLVETFYGRVLKDPELSSFFEHTPMEKLRKMQGEFFSAALDGPVPYSGQPVGHVHSGRGIQRQHLARFLEHLLQTLKDLRLSEQEVYNVISRVNMYADEVTGDNVPG